MAHLRHFGCFLLALSAGLVVSQAAEPLRISFGSAAPLEYADAQGQAQGFTVDVMREAARRAGIAIVWQPGGMPDANNASLRRGSLDMICAGAESPERRREFYVSDAWWWGEMVGITRNDSPLRSDTDFHSSRLAVPLSGGNTVSARYPGTTVSTSVNARGSVAKVCGGEADAAVIENMYLRELLPGIAPVCRDVSLRVFDVGARREYHIIARPGVREQATVLRSQIDEMTADGTLAIIAARRLPVSTPQATRIAELLRTRHERQLSRIRIATGLFVMVVFLTFFIWQQSSRARLRAVNVRLESAQRDLETALAQLETTFDSLTDAVVVFNPAGEIVYRNQTALQMTALNPGVNGATVFDLPLCDADVAPDSSPFRRILNGDRLRAETFRLGAAPKLRYVEISGSLTRGKTARPLVAVAAIRDVTEAKRAEEEHERLRTEVSQTQKMESVGRLAGGVAHDFNNLLTVINGYAEMLMENPLVPRMAADQVRAIGQAGETAAQLTGQLLAFSRKQAARTEVLDLNRQVADTVRLLRRMMGEDIEIVAEIPGMPLLVAADQTQLRQLLMNLAINARDAMPKGGKLWIEVLPVSSPEGAGVELVRLRVSDSGEGMTEEVLSHIFEPFFTTKAPGTGLGLAIVYAVVRQWGGTIAVSSQPGAGTTFEILLPRAGETPERVIRKTASVARGNETILLVEDQEQVRGLARQILADRDYRVLEAAGGEQAMAVEQSFDGPIDLLLTDVVMPGMSGPELAERLLIVRPRLKVLFMSGYTDDVLGRQGILESDVELIGKPFTPGALAQRVRAILGALEAGI